MKTNRLCLVVTLGLAIVFVIGILAMRLISPQKNNSAPSHSEQGDITNIQLVAKNSTVTNENTKKINETDGFFKTIIDTQSGQYAVVNSDKQTVTSKDKNGKIIWSVDVAKSFPDSSGFMPGQRKIYSMALFSNLLVVDIGRATVVIDKQNGKVKRVSVY